MPLGLDALDMLRIEAGLIFAGYEFDDQVDPFEAGIGFTVTADKEDDFVGREALARTPRAPAAAPRRARARGQRDGRARRLCPRRPLAGRRRHERHALAGAEEEHRALPDGGAVRRAGHRGRGREARRPPEADPRHRRALPVLRPREDCARARDRVVHGRPGRGVRPRRLPHPRGGPRLADGARPPARAVRAAVRRRLRDGHQAGRGQLGAGPRPGGPHAADLQRLAGRHA